MKTDQMGIVFGGLPSHNFTSEVASTRAQLYSDWIYLAQVSLAEGDRSLSAAQVLMAGPSAHVGPMHPRAPASVPGRHILLACAPPARDLGLMNLAVIGPPTRPHSQSRTHVAASKLLPINPLCPHPAGVADCVL
jgi:hypothetical protein